MILIYPESDELFEKDNNSNFTVDKSLDELAKKISRAKIPEISSDLIMPETDFVELPEESMIVSETLAKIYLAQGEYNEAVKVYQKLCVKNPDKKEYYDKKIKEIKEEFNS